VPAAHRGVPPAILLLERRVPIQIVVPGLVQVVRRECPLRRHELAILRQDLFAQVQELRFASTFSGPFQTIFGGFYSASTRPRDYEWNSPGFAAATGSPSNLILSFIDSREATEEAVFGDVSYDILPDLKATAGVRWYRDIATFHQFTNGAFYGFTPSTYVAPSTTESGVTPRYLLEYKVTPDLLVYASGAKGFREGGNNIALPTGPPPIGCDQDLANVGLTAAQVATFKSDDLWSYELGFKSSFADRRYTLNGAGFLIDWSNIQQQISLPLCGYGITGNSGAARSTGFEAHPQRPRLRHQTSPRGLRVGQPGFRAGLLCPERAAVSAVAAHLALLATHNIARHGRRVPSQSVQPALQNLFACRNAIVIKVYRKPRAHGIETAGVLFVCKPRHTRGSPFTTHVFWGSKRCAVIDDCPAAQALAC